VTGVTQSSFVPACFGAGVLVGARVTVGVSIPGQTVGEMVLRAGAQDAWRVGLLCPDRADEEGEQQSEEEQGGGGKNLTPPPPLPSLASGSVGVG